MSMTAAHLEPQEAELPVSVYHWTDCGDFDRFRYTEDIGFHFGSYETADARAKQVRGPVPASHNERMLEVGLSIQKMLALPDLLTWEPRAVITALEHHGLLPENVAYDAVEVDRDFVAMALKAYGYDAIQYENKTEGGGFSWIVFDPDKITILSSKPLLSEL